jgi:VCBS repeat-containing protein
LNIENTGNAPNTFALSDSGGSWNVTISESSVALDAGESAELTVVVTIPVNADNGDSDSVTITASGSGGAMDSSVLTTGAVVSEYRIYLSIIFK